MNERISLLGRAADDEVQDVLYDLSSASLAEQADVVVEAFSRPEQLGKEFAERLIDRAVAVAHELLTDPRVSREQALRIIRAAAELCQCWFSAGGGSDDLVYMFWDRLVFSRWSANSPLRQCAPELADALGHLLTDKSDRVIRGALHGLNHMPEEHRSTPIAAFIRGGPPESLRILAEQALLGRLQ